MESKSINSIISSHDFINAFTPFHQTYLSPALGKYIIVSIFTNNDGFIFVH